MNEHLRRIQAVTRYYEWVQGLRFLPLGVVMLGFAAWMATLPSQAGLPHAVALGVLGLGLVGALVLYPVTGSYYRRRFGDVKPSQQMRQTRLRLVVLFGLGGLLVGLGLAMLARGEPLDGMAVTALLALGGVTLLAYWAVTGRFAPHYPPVAVGMGMLALAHHLGLNPLCGLLHTQAPSSVMKCGFITVQAAWGLMLVVLSLLDHRLLVRTLRPAPVDETPARPEVAA
ncbi:hypothetical protein SAMN05443572_10698 [Myxococcus fulvus]|uniref:Uncharacterized protein n=1 Tax=Myxococcus fulvus TaxID=33 RepID=A0A511T4D2_MYXFU|nr:hypothetical protein [Myxococcus fulvus]GEN08473.1 hypothetical protein MFU01_35100 [Myxococcus fulvus]SEU20116.1 hypothetical protein SAMN05443572_10698 [Myxococcus fulvus]